MNIQLPAIGSPPWFYDEKLSKLKRGDIMKIGILVREDTLLKCTGKGCLNALLQRKDAFSRYREGVELLTFTHTGGDLNRKIEKMLEAGIEIVHLSSCLRAKSQEYQTLIKHLSEYFTVVGYTHGSEEGKGNTPQQSYYSKAKSHSHKSKEMSL